MSTAVHEHKQKAKKSCRCFVITVSDTRSEATDESGRVMRALLTEGGHEVSGYRIVRDDPPQIKGLLDELLASDSPDVILLSGGTGISPRDGTYEVVDGLLEKRVDGFGELFRHLSFTDIGSAAMLSRAVAGVARGKILFSMPGSKAAVELAMRRLILPELGHMVSLVQEK